MLRSAQNFATGFFGYPAEEQYNLEVTIEAWGVNNTLAPYMTVSRSTGARKPELVLMNCHLRSPVPERRWYPQRIGQATTA